MEIKKINDELDFAYLTPEEKKRTLYSSIPCNTWHGWDLVTQEHEFKETIIRLNEETEELETVLVYSYQDFTDNDRSHIYYLYLSIEEVQRALKNESEVYFYDKDYYYKTLKIESEEYRAQNKIKQEKLKEEERIKEIQEEKELLEKLKKKYEN